MMRTGRQQLAEAKAAHNHPTYSKMSFIMGCGVQGPGNGSHVVDERGKAYLSMFDQYGNQSFGYSHPRLIAAIRQQLDTGILNSTKIMFEEVQIRLCERLSAATGHRLPFAYLANSGGESIDNALKLARAATGRPKFITASGCFHGKTFAALSASNRPEHLALFQPLLDGFHQVPFNDIDALSEQLDRDTAAVLLEPVQAEAGVFVPDPGYLAEVRRLCSEAGALLIFDEMQTAFGRCGSLFAFQHYDVVPDLMCIGKAFGGGMLGISAVLGTREVWGSLIGMPSTFGSSLGGNPLSCRVALEVIEIAAQEGFLESVRAKGNVLTRRLGELKTRFPGLIREHRGVGMMHGLEFHDQSVGGLVLGLLLEHGVTSTYSLYNNYVLRVQPPMVITDEELGHGLDVIEHVLSIVDGLDLKPSPFSISLPLRETAENVLRSLHRDPYLLDPFVRDDEESVFGEWVDTVELDIDGVTLSAEPGWPWEKLERTFKVRSNADGGCLIDVRVDWDAGAGVYEGLLAGRISHLIAERIGKRQWCQ